MLLEECNRGGVELRLSTPVGEIGHSDGLFRVAGATARQLVVATGGPSIPKMGATGVAYDIARRFGLEVVTPRPALVPFTLGEEDALFKGIPGVAFPVTARVPRRHLRGGRAFHASGSVGAGDPPGFLLLGAGRSGGSLLSCPRRAITCAPRAGDAASASEGRAGPSPAGPACRRAARRGSP
jgi:hypothetical protein